MRIATGIIALFVLQAGHMFLSDVWPWQGPVAKASSQKEIDKKIEILLSQSTRNLKIGLAQEICRLVQLRQQANDADNERLVRLLNQSYEVKQEEYADLNKGARYPTSECLQDTSAAVQKKGPGDMPGPSPSG